MTLIIIFDLLFLMIIKSNFPFHLLTHPHKLLNDQDYLLSSAQFTGLSGWAGGCWAGLSHCVVVQLCGNDSEIIEKADRQVQRLCHAISVVQFFHLHVI
jgi:hypothetical protein